ncbi:hypothetical protein JW978_02180 [Candidatus Dojkabacteria bacterium]|nr:hypothetical protein [Candidatus Dojkabacteria bacterium]
MALPAAQAQPNINKLLDRVEEALRGQNPTISAFRISAIRNQIERVVSDPSANTAGVMASLGINITDRETLRSLETEITQTKQELIEAQKEAESKNEVKEEQPKEQTGGGGGDDDVVAENRRVPRIPRLRRQGTDRRSKKAKPQKQSPEEEQQSIKPSEQETNLPPKPKETQLPKQLQDLNTQIAALENNLELAGAKANPSIREQILNRKEQLTREKAVLERNLTYLEELNKYNKIKQEFGSYTQAVEKLSQNQPNAAPEEIRKQKAQKFATLQNQARYLEQSEQRLGRMADQVGPDLQKYKPETIKPQSNSELIERDLIQGGFDFAADLSKEDVRKIARERSNPYDVIGINKDKATPQNLKAAYSTTLARLAKSDDPNAAAAIKNLQSTYGLLNSVSNEMTQDQVREMADKMLLERAKARAAATRKELKQGKNIWEQKIEKKEKVNIRDWYSNRKKDYESRKGQYYRTGLGYLPRKAGQGTMFLGKQAGRGVGAIGRAGRKGVAGIGRSIATSRIVQWTGKTRLGRWTFEKGRQISILPRRLRNGLARIDESIGDRISRKLDRDVKYKRYQPQRKAFSGLGIKRLYNDLGTINLKKKYEERKSKSKSKTLLAVGVGAKAYLGKILNTLNNVRRIVQNGAYTMSGLKTLNNGAKALSNSITNTKTRIMGGVVGKGLIGAQRALNGVRALARATGSGLRYGAIGAGLALAMGGGTPAILAAAALSGGAGAALKLTTDTLNSTKLSPFGRIADFQKAHGVLGKEMRLQQGLSASRSLTTRGYTFARSLNTGFYGFAGGAAIAALLGASPLVALAAGATAGGAALGARYLTGRLAVNASAKIATSSTLMALGKLPFMELVGLATAAPWINSQLSAMRAQGLDYFSANWSPTHLKSWLNYLKGAELGFNVGGIYGGISAMAAIQGINLGAAALGTLSGAGIGIAIAYATGTPIGTFMVAGGIIGGITGGFIGTIIGTPLFGVALGSVISYIGSQIGAAIDKLLGNVDVLKNVLAGLSLMKTLYDFVDTLTKKFDPTAAFGLAFALVMMGTTLVDLGFDKIPDNQSTRPSQSVAQAAPASRIKGETIEIITLDCETDSDHKLYNPKTSEVTQILKTGEIYEIHTNDAIFKNITKPARIEKYATLGNGVFVGSCNP